MNKSYSGREYFYERWLAPLLHAAIQEHPVVVLSGARQAGKSTLLQRSEMLKDWRYQDLDDFDALQQAREQPEELWAGTDRVIIDEVQRVPETLLAVKRAVDRGRGRKRFVLSGSANLLLHRDVTESLAGRAVYLVLHPLTLGEIHAAQPPHLLALLLKGERAEEEHAPLPARSETIDLLLRGFMPPLTRLESTPAWDRWWEGYIATYLERDLRQFAQIESLVDFRRLMRLAALRTGQILNQSGLGRDAALSQPTAHRYLNLLETTQLFERLPPFLESRSLRLVKAPKCFWNDPALAAHLSGYYDGESLRMSRELGSYFESMIFHHLRVLAQLMTPSAKLYYWRTRNGPQEVDFVFEHGHRLLGIEVKWSTEVGYRDTASLRSFLDHHPRAAGGLILYAGGAPRQLGPKILAVPWSWITG